MSLKNSVLEIRLETIPSPEAIGNMLCHTDATADERCAIDRQSASCSAQASAPTTRLACFQKKKKRSL